jgi:hypothetical protein
MLGAGTTMVGHPFPEGVDEQRAEAARSAWLTPVFGGGKVA